MAIKQGYTLAFINIILAFIQITIAHSHLKKWNILKTIVIYSLPTVDIYFSTVSHCSETSMEKWKCSNIPWYS
jgi:hypothetical protein